MAGNQYPDGCAACPSPPAAPQNRAAPGDRGPSPAGKAPSSSGKHWDRPQPRHSGTKSPPKPRGDAGGAVGREEAALAEGKNCLWNRERREDKAIPWLRRLKSDVFISRADIWILPALG